MGSGNGTELGAGFLLPEVMAHVRSHSKHGFYTCLPFITTVSSEKSRGTHNSVEVIPSQGQGDSVLSRKHRLTRERHPPGGNNTFTHSLIFRQSTHYS